MFCTESKIINNNNKSINRSGSEVQFPGKLHTMMSFVERESLESIVSWVMNGTAIMVHDPENLVKILPLFFSQTKFRSFQRQLNMWRFERILDGPFKGAFSHPYFLQSNKALCKKMSRHVDIATLKKTIAAESKKLNVLPTPTHSLINLLPMPTLRTVSVGSLSQDSFCSVSSALATAQSILNMPSSGRIAPTDESKLQDGDLVAFEGRQFHFVDGGDDMEPISLASDLSLEPELPGFSCLPTVIQGGFQTQHNTLMSMMGRRDISC